MNMMAERVKLIAFLLLTISCSSHSTTKTDQEAASDDLIPVQPIVAGPDEPVGDGDDPNPTDPTLPVPVPPAKFVYASDVKLGEFLGYYANYNDIIYFKDSRDQVFHVNTINGAIGKMAIAFDGSDCTGNSYAIPWNETPFPIVREHQIEIAYNTVEKTAHKVDLSRDLGRLTYASRMSASENNCISKGGAISHSYAYAREALTLDFQIAENFEKIEVK